MSQYNGLEEKRILVVEDVELNQYLARHIMEKWGCVVEIAENGRTAVEKLDKADFDLVLMDIQMPVMDGIEATKQIRSMKDEKKSSVPIVALTANTYKEDYEQYRNVGMNDCLAKPFAEPALFRMVLNNIRNGSCPESSVCETDKSKQGDCEEKIYNLTMVESISGGDRSFVEKMLRLFLETVPGTLDEMRTAADKREWLVLSKLAHKLKSTIDSMGIASLKQDIRSIEAGGKTGANPEELLKLLDKVIEVMNLVMSRVRVDWGM